MLRLSTLAARQLARRAKQPRSCAVRHASSGGAGKGGGGAGKVVAGTLLATTGLVGGAVGYAAVDPAFRKTVEDTIPGSEDLLQLILGPPPAPALPTKPVPSKLKIPGPVVVTGPKETKELVKEPPSLPVVESEPPPPPVEAIPPPPLEALPPPPPPEAIPPPPEAAQPAVEAVPVPPPAVEAAPPTKAASLTDVTPPFAEPVIEVPPAVDEPVSATNDEVPIIEPEVSPQAPAEEPLVVSPPAATENVKLDEMATLTDIVGAEFTPDVENSSLEQVLVELCKEMKATTAAACKGYEISSEAVVAHINIMQKVLESNLASREEAAWNQVFEAASAKSDAVRFAETREKEAEAAIRNVLESIAAGRKNKSTATNPQLIVAEEAANRALYQLEQAKARIASVEAEARVMEQYRDLVEEGRQQFHREMASIMPDVKLGEKNSKLTEDELNMFITHAYRKVLYLQQELAKQQTLEQQRFKQALEKQRLETQMAASEKVDIELERQKRELEVEYQRRLAAIREESEAELRTQLRRQAAAHSDHLADVLSVQESELKRKHQHDLDEKLSRAESEHLTKVAALHGGLAGLMTAMESRAASDKAAVAAQQLWLACVAAEAALRSGRNGAATWEESMRPLSSEIAAIQASAGGEDEFVGAVVGGIPPVVLSRGVYTEESLRQRFTRVETVARRVGSIGEDGGSLLKYGLSYLESLLLVDLVERKPTPPDQPLDIDSLSTADILCHAKYSLERGDMAQAVQYMALLKGEPGRVAGDWLAEARLHLEARQAATALIAHAAARGAEVLPKP